MQKRKRQGWETTKPKEEFCFSTHNFCIFRKLGDVKVNLEIDYLGNFVAFQHDIVRPGITNLPIPRGDFQQQQQTREKRKKDE